MANDSTTRFRLAAAYTLGSMAAFEGINNPLYLDTRILDPDAFERAEFETGYADALNMINGQDKE